MSPYAFPEALCASSGHASHSSTSAPLFAKADAAAAPARPPPSTNESQQIDGIFVLAHSRGWLAPSGIIYSPWGSEEEARALLRYQAGGIVR